jgi:hypothetical protein
MGSFARGTKLAFRRGRWDDWNQPCMAAWLPASHPVTDARAGRHQMRHTDATISVLSEGACCGVWLNYAASWCDRSG